MHAMRSGAANAGPGTRSRARAAFLRLSARVLAAVVGGYAMAALAVSGASAGLSMLGMARAEAVVLCAMLGFVLYLLVLLWAFAERRLWRVLTVLGASALAGWAWMGP